MTTEISKKIKIKEKRFHKLLSNIFDLNNMVWGSFCLIHVKCGKKYCRCQKGILHPHNRMSWRENGRSISRAVPKEDHKWMEGMTENYRKFKKLRRELLELEEEISVLLDEFESFVVMRTRRGKSYLEIS